VSCEFHIGGLSRAAAGGPAGSVVEVIDKVLTWCREHRTPETYEWYRWRLQLFCDYLKKRQLTQLLVPELKPFHIDEFLAGWPGWAPGMKHGACRAVQRSMRWAEKKGHIERSPVAHYEKPRPGKRNVVIPLAECERVLALAGSREFKDLLEVTWETAARPQESLAVEARHVDLQNARWVFPPDESKGEQWPRVVYLTEQALAITRRLMLKNPAGCRCGRWPTPCSATSSWCRRPSPGPCRPRARKRGP
jgi:integrase